MPDDALLEALGEARAAAVAAGMIAFPGPDPKMTAAIQAMNLPPSILIVQTQALDPDPRPAADPAPIPAAVSPMSEAVEQRSVDPPPSIKPYSGGRLVKPEPSPVDALRQKLEGTGWSLHQEPEPDRFTVLKDGGRVFTDSLYGCEQFAKRLWLPIKPSGDLYL